MFRSFAWFCSPDPRSDDQQPGERAGMPCLGFMPMNVNLALNLNGILKINAAT
jgi:hypothetical protein